MAVVTTNLGVVTAYGDAVAAGYTGTKAEWQELMASYATVAEEAAQSATDAETAKNAAVTAKTGAETAKTDAIAAKTAAQAAQTAAETAQGKAETAQGAAEDAAESVSASAAQIATNTSDISDLKENLNGKVAIEQGVTHAGEALIIGADGKVTTGEAGVSVDPTLTIEGKAADAKAVGDNLAIVTKGHYEYSGNVVDARGVKASANGYLNDNIVRCALNDGVYYTNPFTTATGKEISIIPKKSDGSSVGITRGGTAEVKIAFAHQYVWKIQIEELVVRAYGYASLAAFESGTATFNRTYDLSEKPAYWCFTGNGFGTNGTIDRGLTKDTYSDVFIEYTEPTRSYSYSDSLDEYIVYVYSPLLFC